MITPDRRTFHRLAEQGNCIPLAARLLSDQITPVVGYRRLVDADDRTAPSFLLESVDGGRMAGRYSFLGAQPALEITARGHDVTVDDHRRSTSSTRRVDDPLTVPRELGAHLRPVRPPASGGFELPRFLGGWVGYAGYDTVRYLEPERLPFTGSPPDDRGIPDLHLGLYREVAIFDRVSKVLHAVVHVMLDEHDSVDDAWRAGCRELEAYVERLQRPRRPLAAGTVGLDPSRRSDHALESNMTKEHFEAMVRRTVEYIGAGDVFQCVVSQRFRRRTTADPFDVYRALRIVNPSPYMFYLQAPGAILVAASPELLCSHEDGRVVNRPLAGTRKRGADAAEDAALEADLLADAKERAEHVMLVDLGRNDLGRVCTPASIELEKIMDVERYSHVMHLSSTVSGRLADGLDAWDLMRGCLPVGTVSGAPKIRAMQIIDELEPTRRGPYAGGVGVCGLDGSMSMAIALRTMVVPTAMRRGGEWTIDLQAGAGIVADSVPDREYEETVTKAAALARAIDLAEDAFRGSLVAEPSSV
ncbi:MAG: anthranilate synthase component I [Phycisphaerales bacterium]